MYKVTVEYLKQIREQEELAEKIRQDGLSESKRILNAANDDAAALIKKAQSETDAMYREAIAKAEDEARLEYEKTIERATGECRGLYREAGSHVEAAVSIIVEKVLN